MDHDNIHSRLKAIQAVFPASTILNRTTENPESIARYYRTNRLAYTIFNSRKGFVHMGVSYDGIFKEDDFFNQGRIVGEYIQESKAQSVLELAPGKAATTIFLAKEYPQIAFHGIDLPNGQLDMHIQAKRPNIHLITGNFHDLSHYAAQSQDVVYVIEALCHATDRLRVITEVQRVLKPHGYFIVFDGYLRKQEQLLTNDEVLASQLLFKSMMVTAKNHYYPNFKKDLATSGLAIVDEEDLTEAIIPSLERLEGYASKYISHPRVARVLQKVFPNEFLGNAIAGYLFPVTVKQGLFSYYLTVAEKSA